MGLRVWPGGEILSKKNKNTLGGHIRPPPPIKTKSKGKQKSAKHTLISHTNTLKKLVNGVHYLFIFSFVFKNEKGGGGAL